MTKEEKVDKILLMMKELYKLNCEDLEENDLDKLYYEVKFALETEKELRGIVHD